MKLEVKLEGKWIGFPLRAETARNPISLKIIVMAIQRQGREFRLTKVG